MTAINEIILSIDYNFNVIIIYIHTSFLFLSSLVNKKKIEIVKITKIISAVSSLHVQYIYIFMTRAVINPYFVFECRVFCDFGFDY